MPKGSKVTDKESLFVVEYLKDLNATDAYMRAFGLENRKSAGVQASVLMSKPRIKAAIQKAMDARAQRVEITADMILREILLIAKTDLANAYDEGGRLRPIHEIPEDTRRAIAGVKVFEEFEGFGKERHKIGEVRELKMWDKLKALELLGKHLKLFKETVEITGTLEQLIAGSRKAE